MNATDTICDRPIRHEGHIMIYCAIILGSFAGLAVLMRLYVAIRQRSFGYDDLFACLAAGMSLPNSAGLARAGKLGLGRDIWTLKPYQISRVQKVNNGLHCSLAS